MTTELTPFAEIHPPPADPGAPTAPSEPALGRLVGVARWFAARRDATGELVRPRLVLVTGAHRTDGSAGAADRTGRSDEDVTVLLAEAHGVGVVRVDTAAEMPVPTGTDAGPGVSDGVGGDVLDHDGSVAAVELGRRLADREIDAGADFLVPGMTGSDHSLPLGVLTAILTGLEPVAAVAVPDTDPTPWVRAVIALRDTLFRLRDRDKDVLSLIAAVGGVEFGVLAGLLAQAAARRTPVLLDGLPATLGAVLAHRLAPGAEAWFLAAGEAPDRPGRRLQDMLGLRTVAALETSSPTGGGAVLLLPLIQAALATAGQVAAGDPIPRVSLAKAPAGD